MNEQIKNIIKAITGLTDRVRTEDRLDVRMERAPLVICVSCAGEPYYLSIDGKGRRKLVATETQKTVRPDLRCPLCGKMLCAYERGTIKLKTDQGWK